MKKFKSFLLVAAALVMGLASCNSETNEVVETAPKQLSVRIGGVVGPRAIEAPGVATPGTIQLTNAHLFVISSANTVVHYQELTIGAGDNQAQHPQGELVTEPVASDARIYVLGNVPSGVDVSNLTTLAAINDFAQSITTQENYREVVLANVNATPTAIVAGEQPHPTAPGNEVDAHVLVEVNPVIARMELHSLRTPDTFDANGFRITGFRVVGVFVDSHAPSFTFGGSYSGALTQIGTNTQGGVTTSNFVADVNLATYDAGVWTGGWEATGTPLTARPHETHVWAYNVAADAVLYPRLVIRLADIRFEEEDGISSGVHAQHNLGDAFRYLTVTAINFPGGATRMTRGNIYRLGGEQGISFELDDLGLTPNPVDLDLAVTVEIVEWQLHDVTVDL